MSFSRKLNHCSIVSEEDSGRVFGGVHYEYAVDILLIIVSAQPPDSNLHLATSQLVDCSTDSSPSLVSVLVLVGLHLY